MKIGKIRRHRIRNNGGLVSVVKSLARGFFHTDLCHGAGDDERFNASLAQGVVQLCSVEGTITEFVNHQVFLFRRKFVNDLDTFQSLVNVGVEALVSGMAGQRLAAPASAKTPKAAWALGRPEIVCKRSVGEICGSAE